ncbi:MAG: acetate CoA-transferase subunit alpha [Sporomusaceae bacterium]|nr:acetate CoA-transferase subunit alpha [Sporomusaceae bacterium]
MNKVRPLAEAVAAVKDGATVMIGGFLGVGTPAAIIDALVAKGVKDLTVIANDTAMPEVGIGKLVVTRQLKKAIVSHIGTNPETGRQMIAGELDVVLTPQGTLAEQIRAGGAGLGGILTPTGVGTVVEEGKQKLTLAGREYLVELPLRADVALLKAHKADKAGNLVLRRSAKNFNPLMALAAGTVIAEVEQIVETGAIDPDEVTVPGVVVDIIVQGKGVAVNG